MKQHYIGEKQVLVILCKAIIICLTLHYQMKKRAEPVGVWGQRQLKYIKQYHKVHYTNLLTSCKLSAYLAGIDNQAEKCFCGW